jgi:hypothetical protein
METMEERTVLNQAQLEFLQLLGHIKTKEELDELREVVCDFYARKIDEGMENLWQEGKWSQEIMDNILKEDLHASRRHAYAE